MTRKLVQVTGYIVSGLLILYILVSFIIPEQSMNVFGFRTFIVLSSSMEPEINVNDMIIIKNPNEDRLEERDIITFEVYIPELGEKSYVTHYIGEITTDGTGTTIYKTQGASKEPGDYDEWTDASGTPTDITFDDIEGVYVFRIPLIGYAISALRDPIFLGLLVLNGTIIYFTYRYIKGIIKDQNEQTKKTE